MSPQSRRGRAIPAGHHKTSARNASRAAAPDKASTKAAAPDKASTKAVEPEETPVDEMEPVAEELTPSQRRVRRRARAHRNPVVSGFMGYVGAYLPLLAVFIAIFAAVWAYNSFAPHTLSPVENFKQAENAWKPSWDSARARVNAADGNFAAQMAAYKDLSKATKGWMDELSKVQSWNDGAHTDTQNQTTASQMTTFIQDGRNLVTVIDEVTTANTPAALLAHAADLESVDNSFTGDYRLIEYDVLGVTSAVTPVPTLNLPTGSLPPSAGPSAESSGSAGPSASAGASEAPSASTVPSPSVAPSPSAS